MAKECQNLTGNVALDRGCKGDAWAGSVEHPQTADEQQNTHVCHHFVTPQKNRPKCGRLSLL
jgi:hypothetical protein